MPMCMLRLNTWCRRHIDYCESSLSPSSSFCFFISVCFSHCFSRCFSLFFDFILLFFACVSCLFRFLCVLACQFFSLSVCSSVFVVVQIVTTCCQESGERLLLKAQLGFVLERAGFMREATAEFESILPFWSPKLVFKAIPTRDMRPLLEARDVTRGVLRYDLGLFADHDKVSLLLT